MGGGGECRTLEEVEAMLTETGFVPDPDWSTPIAKPVPTVPTGRPLPLWVFKAAGQ